MSFKANGKWKKEEEWGGGLDAEVVEGGLVKSHG